MSHWLGPKQLRLVREDDTQHYPKASLLLRAGARLVDTVTVWVLYKSTGPAGIVIALLYLLFADGFLQGQSLGKKLFGVKVVYLPTRQGARHRDSVLRNAPFGLVIILSMMPELGKEAFIGGLLVICGVEAFKVWKDRDGLRLGDLWAQTQVIDGKVSVAQGGIAEGAQEARATGRLMKQGLSQRSDDAV
ncbi:MAG: RDD family protein [Myxococcaceae bacterium]|nr:RDD family protein [Myxococcaceae bacterium]